MLSVLAAGGIVSLIEMVRGRQARRLLGVIGIVTGTVLVGCLPGPFCEETLDYDAELDYLVGRHHFQEAQQAADVHIAADHIRSAKESFQRAVERNPGFADAWNELGNVYYVEGREAKAAGADLALFPEMWSIGYTFPKQSLHDPTPRLGPAEFAAMAAEACSELLSQLDDDLRPVALAKLEDYTNKEIATKLDCSISTVERSLRLIRKIWRTAGATRRSR